MLKGRRGEYVVNYFAQYSWLFLFLFGAVSVMFYFGMYPYLFHGKTICTFGIDFYCKEAAIDEDGLSFVLQNNQPYPIEITAAEISGVRCTNAFSLEKPAQSRLGGEHTFDFQCSRLPRIVKGEVRITYRSVTSGLEHVEKGEFRIVS